MEKKSPHYRQFLERELEARQRKNSSYSLRAFARDLEMPPSKLSEVLRGLRGVSRQTARNIVQKIGLSESEGVIFMNLVDFHQSKNKRIQEAAREELRRLSAADEYGELSLERFKIIADWYHFAILELTEIDGFESHPSWIAGRLGISTKEAEAAIARLEDFGLLERTRSGGLKQTHRNLATPSGIPSREIREHHSQILAKADAALTNVEVAERDFSAITLAFHSEQMPEIRRELKAMRRRIGKVAQNSQKKDRVYCFSIQFFPMDKKDSKTKEHKK